jgi:transcription elongation factor Elf1
VPEAQLAASELTCTICTDSSPYFAVGKCNHHICSMCAVRMRLKSKDKHCAICKEELRVMIVFRVNVKANSTAALPAFSSFGLSEADCDADHANLPGVRVDPVGGFLFVDCTQHFNEIERLRSITCPLKSCGARFPTVSTLQKHLHNQHDGLTLCTLCVENRPLFISEHSVMTPKQLTAHMKGEVVGGAHSANDHTAGHPSCQFCTERFFDKAALYYHMQRNYFTCHLCPRQYMFRYYIDAQALREHHNREHIVCHVCAAVPQLLESGVAVAFRDAHEYSEHMRQIHNTQVSSVAGGGSSKLSFRLGASSTYQNVSNNVRRDKNGRPRATVVDLDMGTAAPFSRSEAAAPAQNNRAAVVPRPTEGVSHLIPTHMRIAGRVTGAGRFAALDSSDLLMQAAAEEYAAAEREQQRGGKKSLRLDRDSSFPALEASTDELRSGVKYSTEDPPLASAKSWGKAAGAVDSTLNFPPPARTAASGPPAAELHPMSILHAGKQQAKDLQRRKDAETAERLRQEKQRQEDKRIERNISLASALLGGPSARDKEAKPLTLTAADVGATLTNRIYVRSLVGPLEHLGWSEAELLRSIYPPVLVHWARQNKTELVKIEKKLYTLMTDPQLNSIQLKPMDKGMRTVVHQISRMYLLNSYEFDAEPNRYVSLVKQIDSYLPVCPLSRAAAMPVFTPPGDKGEPLPDVPVVYLTLSSERYSAGLVNTNSSVSSAGKKGTVTASSGEPVRIAFTVAEIVSRVNGLLESPDLWRAWYQHAVLTEGRDLEAPPPAEHDSLGLPPPPPGFATSPSASVPGPNPRALSDLPVPRLTGLVAAGASGVGLRFADRSTAQLALQFLKYCLALHTAPTLVTARGAQRTPTQASLLACATTLTPKQQQELLVLSVFHQHAGFVARTVAEIVYDVPVSGVKAAAPSSDAGAVVAALDRRHYAPRSDVSSAPAIPAVATSHPGGAGTAVHEGGWQQQAVKTRRFDAEVVSASALQDSWEDMDEVPDLSAPTEPSAAEPTEDTSKGADSEEWEQFLRDKRAKAQESGAAPRYEPKRSETASAPIPAAKYVPPGARKQAEGKGTRSAPRAPAPVVVAEDEYDLCDRTLHFPSAVADTAAHAAPGQVYATDYLDSDEAFEEFLRKTRLEHVPGEVRAVPFNPASHLGAAGHGAVGGVAAVAVPISDDMTDEEAARMVLRNQLQRDQRSSQLNRFGILDEDEDQADEND